LSEHIPLQGAQRIAGFYGHVTLGDALTATATHYDHKTSATEAFLESQIQDALRRPSEAMLIVNFNPATIQKDRTVWNGGNGGPWALAIAYDAAQKLVTVTDANVLAMYRAWSVPLAMLWESLIQIDRISGRSRGTLLLEKNTQTYHEQSKGYDMRRAMVHHPFKPTVSTTASVLSLAVSEMLQKSYSQEDIIYNTRGFDFTTFTQRGRDVGAVVDDANFAFDRLHLPLVAEPLPHGSVQDVRRAVEGTDDGLQYVLVVLYDTLRMHKLDGFGYGAAVVNNRGEEGVVKLVDGNPTVFGDFWTTSVEELSAALLGLVIVKGKMEEELEC
jgi:hypothetical protein